MIKVITYGTYDLLHYGHIRLLERAKLLGDYLIVGITSDDFDKSRGKINVKQALAERIKAVRETGLADEIIIEEYEGQKIDDIRRLDIDIFTVGSDWEGKFDYLKKYCQVIYLERTEGVSSSDLRSTEKKIRVGVIGNAGMLGKYIREVEYVNGLEISGFYADDENQVSEKMKDFPFVTAHYRELLENTDAIFVFSHPLRHYADVKYALEHGKHVLCEAPVAVNGRQAEELFHLAARKGCIFFDSVKTAYATAYKRALLLAAGGKIGEVVSIQTTCTSMREKQDALKNLPYKKWNSMCAWGPTALLPVFQLFGTDYNDLRIISRLSEEDDLFDEFSKIDFYYKETVASVQIGKAVKAEGELVIAGTEGYIYIPAPWWKTDYFEIRYENPEDNKRYFYQLDGEGLRYEFVSFVRSIQDRKNYSAVSPEVSVATAKIMEDFYNRRFIRI